MNPEKKKLMVVIALVVVILGVGAFQVLRGSEPEPTATKKDDAKKANPDATKPTGPKNLGLYPLTVHDPFVPAAFMNEGEWSADNADAEAARQTGNRRKRWSQAFGSKR